MKTAIRSAGIPRTRSIQEISAATRRSSSHDAVHLEHLGILAVHVDAMHAREVPYVSGVRIAAVMLRRVLLERRDLPLDVRLLERDVPLVLEVEVVPRDLVTEDRRALEGAQPLLRDGAVVLVNGVKPRLKAAPRLPLFPERDEQLEDVLTPLGERADVEVVHRERLGGDPELGRRLRDLSRERIRRKAGGQRARRDRERDIADIAAGIDKSRHRSTAAELTVVSVR